MIYIYSMDFILYLFNNDDKINYPLIIILVDQIPYNKNYLNILYRELSAFKDSEDNIDNNIGFHIYEIITYIIKFNN